MTATEKIIVNCHFISVYYMIICFINYLGQRPFPTAPKYSRDNVDIKIKLFVTVRLDILISLHFLTKVVQ